MKLYSLEKFLLIGQSRLMKTRYLYRQYKYRYRHRFCIALKYGVSASIQNLLKISRIGIYAKIE